MESELVTASDGVDFTIPESLSAIVEEVRAYVTEDVLPAESEIPSIHELD